MNTSSVRPGLIERGAQQNRVPPLQTQGWTGPPPGSHRSPPPMASPYAAAPLRVLPGDPRIGGMYVFPRPTLPVTYTCSSADHVTTVEASAQSVPFSASTTISAPSAAVSEGYSHSGARPRTSIQPYLLRLDGLLCLFLPFQQLADSTGDVDGHSKGEEEEWDVRAQEDDELEVGKLPLA